MQQTNDPYNGWPDAMWHFHLNAVTNPVVWSEDVPEISDVSLPVELSSFSAISGLDKLVRLQFRVESEIENLGFIIYRSNKKDSGFEEIASYKNTETLVGQGNSAIAKTYTFDDLGVWNFQTYYYQLGDCDMNGVITLHNIVSATPGKVDGNNPDPEIPITIPLAFDVKVYPVPANPVATIRTDLAEEGEFTINIYNIVGQLVYSAKGIGRVGANLLTLDLSTYSSGIYPIIVNAGGVNVATRKMVVMK